MGVKVIDIGGVLYRLMSNMDFDISIRVGDLVLRDGVEVLEVSPKLLNAIEQRHVANLDIKKIVRI